MLNLHNVYTIEIENCYFIVNFGGVDSSHTNIEIGPGKLTIWNTTFYQRNLKWFLLWEGSPKKWWHSMEFVTVNNMKILKFVTASLFWIILEQKAELLFFIEGTATGVLESTGRKSVCTKFGLLKILLYLNQVAGVGIVSSNDVRNLLRNELVLRVINLLNVKLNANI